MLNADNDTFDRCLDEAVRFHGHLCGGQIIGVRMALAGMREVGIVDPKGQDRKDLIVVVEIDRCATDAISAVTGLTPGRRTLKIKDFGKMAATFVRLSTGKAVRVCQRAGSRQASDALARTFVGLDAQEANFKALRLMNEADLLDIRPVEVDFHPSDLPGLPTGVAQCTRCGETVLDQREEVVEGQILCRTCATGQAYYREGASSRSRDV